MESTKHGAQIAGLGRFNTARKEDSLRRLRAAAAELFGEKGYHSVSTEDIALLAGVTRKTFYQHFASKNDIAFDVYKRQQAGVAHFWSEIWHRNYREMADIRAWLNQMVDGLASSAVSRVFIIEFSLADKAMTARIRDMAPNLVNVLGKQIPEFEFKKISEANEVRFVDACLLVNQIMNQITMYNAGLLDLRRDLVVERLAKNFKSYLLESPSFEKPRLIGNKPPKVQANDDDTMDAEQGSGLSVRAAKTRKTEPPKNRARK
jgi:AcrR family transcriptional regulator